MRRGPALALAVLLALTVSGCKVMQRISEGAYRNAVSDGVVDELEIRGITLKERPACESPVPATGSVVRVTCTARTADGKRVVVDGVATGADTDRPRERYVVTVGGREVLRKDCLGLGCERPNR
ncbi:hypothetical protein SAMN05443665_1015123 [Actinomadura meyerae]|uniref:DUF4333 domain-containing protein n=1 Tax=Actinomadura meyerae TaxID=240840 RepID=A0A239JPW4_9ACTN|nr:hypothetical protein [Actinomadura meyerae]SNT07921.1 hypothetical protein SAMN05443665_1015123 [Actinomadura meyerae]